MSAIDLLTLNTVVVDMVGGDRILRQGSDSKRLFFVTQGGAAVDISAVDTITCQVRDEDNNALAITATGALEPSEGVNYFSVTFSSAATEAVTEAAGFTFVSETIAGRTWRVFKGVFDVEFNDGGVIGCPAQGKIWMRQGVTR